MSTHPHATNMLLYAKDAAETDKPWKRWKYQIPGYSNWTSLEGNPGWYPEYKYERTPPWELGRSINGHTLPPGAEWHRQDFTADMLPADPPYRPLMFGEARQVEDEWTYDFKEWKSVREYGPAGGSANGGYCHHRTTRPIPFELTPEQLADGWIPWHGGECPVEPESRPTVLMRSSDLPYTFENCSAKTGRWEHQNNGGDIIAYKPDPYGKFRQALADGKVIMFNTAGNNWSPEYSPTWNHAPHRYRIKEPQWLPLGPEDVPPGSVFRAPNFEKGIRYDALSVVETGVIFAEWSADRSSSLWSFGTLMKTGWQINRPRHRDADGNPTLWEPCRKEAP